MHPPPPHELHRSMAADAVGRLAADSAIGLFHFEHRLPLQTPERWLPPGRGDLGAPGEWASGVLAEAKYQAFRHDLLIGSFHPGHRAKWTAHELCHGLAGFAWRPDATPFFHALAARLSEALPVGLWYFLDEGGLRRCPAHAGGGPLYGTYCAACEEAARDGADLDAADRAWSTLGAAFVEREIDSVLRSARDGQMVNHRLGNLDLASDGAAYASAHGRRLASPEFARFVDAFFEEGEGVHGSLEALADRVGVLLEAIVEGAPAPALMGDAGTRMAQDVAWRLLAIRAETDGEAAQGLDGILDTLAGSRDLDGITVAIESYDALHTEFELPSPDDVFALGYDLPLGHGRSCAQIRAGLESACPRLLSRLGEGADEAVIAFLDADVLERTPLGKRFSRWAVGNLTPALADLAALESTLSHTLPPDGEALSFGLGGLAPVIRLDRSLGFLRLGHDVLEEPEGPYAVLDSPLCLVSRTMGDGEVDLIELEPAVMDALEAMGTSPTDAASLRLDGASLQALADHGIIVPDRWPTSRSTSDS